MSLFGCYHSLVERGGWSSISLSSMIVRFLFVSFFFFYKKGYFPCSSFLPNENQIIWRHTAQTRLSIQGVLESTVPSSWESRVNFSGMLCASHGQLEIDSKGIYTKAIGNDYKLVLLPNSRAGGEAFTSLWPPVAWNSRTEILWDRSEVWSQECPAFLGRKRFQQVWLPHKQRGRKHVLSTNFHSDVPYFISARCNGEGAE